MPTSPAPVEQKDTEDYCERMCANVQDEDEEIICGSDGYMYTSESQMECYATCLHIGERKYFLNRPYKVSNAKSDLVLTVGLF